MHTRNFDDIAKAFDERVSKIVWCTFTTLDTAGYDPITIWTA